MSEDLEKQQLMKKIREKIEKEKSIRPPRFCENDSEIVIHGSNIGAYIRDLEVRYKLELSVRVEKIKPKILDFAPDDAGNIEFFIEIFGK